MTNEERAVVENSQRGARVAVLAITAVLGGVLIGARLGAHPLWDPDEAKHAEVAREMLVTGRLLEPLINFEPYHHKPSPLYLAIGAAFRLVGTNELGARLPSAICAWLTLLLVCAHGARRRPAEGLLAALLLASCPLFVLLGRFTNFDAVLTLFMTSAILALARLVEAPSRTGEALLLHASIAFAVLVKGPAAVVLLALPVAFLLLRGDLDLQSLRLVPGLALAAVIVGVWLVPALIYTPAYVAEFLWVHNVERYLAPVGADVFHPQPFWFFLPVLAGALLPWSVWLPAATADALAAAADRPARVLAVYALWVVVFFSLSSGKLATYILPAVPAFALVVARWLVAEHEDRYSGTRAAAVTAGVCSVLAPVAYLYVRHEAPSLAMSAWVLLPVSITGGVLLVVRRPASLRVAVMLCSAMVVTLLAFNAFAARAVSDMVSDADLATIALARGRPQRVIAYRVRPFSFLFYTGWPMQYRVPLDEVRRALYEPGGALLLSEDQWVFHLREAAPGVELVELARNGRHVLYEVRSPWG